MLPSLKPRQHVLSIVSKKIKKDDLVVVKDSLNSKFVKRVMWVDDEKFKVVSDNKIIHHILQIRHLVTTI